MHARLQSGRTLQSKLHSEVRPTVRPELQPQGWLSALQKLSLGDYVVARTPRLSVPH